MPRIKFVLKIFHLYLWNYLISGALAIEVRQSTTNKSVQNGEKKIQNRNPRLIQHIPYYTSASGQQSNAALLPDQSQRYLYESSDVHQTASPTGYAYIPVAYLPGIRTIAYSSHPPSPTSRPNIYGYHRNPYPTSSQIQYSTTTISNNIYTDKKIPASVLDQYPSGNLDTHAADDHFVPPKAISGITPSYNVKLHPTYNFQYQQPEKASIFANVPSSQYLNFRYSDLRQPLDNELTTTPATVEITSPKHYIYSTTTTMTPKSQNYILHTATRYVPFQKPSFAYVTPKSSSPSISVTQASVSIPDSFKPESIATTESRQIWHNIYPNRTQVPYSAIRTIDASADDILSDYNNNHRLPERITPENLKESIRTLSYILQMLRKADSITQFHRQPHKVLHGFGDTQSVQYIPSVNDSKKSAKVTNHLDISYDTYDSTYDDDLKQHVTSQLHSSPYVPQLPYKSSNDEQNVPGRAGIDYPTYWVIPATTFSCKTQRYKGFFADPDTKCQVWHYCDLNGGQASFLCPNGTIFSQVALTCDWWFNVKCAATAQLYVLNERLYKYIIPMRPSFPEDYSGPLVDQYLTEKFKEIESQRKHHPSNDSENDNDINSTITATMITESPKLNLTFFKEYDIPTHLLEENL